MADTIYQLNFTGDQINSLLEKINNLDTELNKYLLKNGGDMTGAINMNSQTISGLNDPTEESQAARKGYVDAAKEEANAYTDAAKEEANAYTDAAKAEANAYTDSKRKIWTTTIPASWTGSAEPYIQTISVPGILATDTPHIMPMYTDPNYSVALAQIEGWSKIVSAFSGDGTIAFYCRPDKPAVAIPIQIEVMR